MTNQHVKTFSVFYESNAAVTHPLILTLSQTNPGHTIPPHS